MDEKDLDREACCPSEESEQDGIAAAQDVSARVEPASQEESAPDAAPEPVADEPQQADEKSEEADKSEAADGAEKTVYRWTYADQLAHDRAADAADKRRHRRGAWVYALIVLGVFAVSFGLLLGVMLVKGGQSDVGTSGTPDVTAIEQVKESVVVIEVSAALSSGTGTGIILTSDGYIATNHHVIEGGGTVNVRLYDGTYATARVIGSSAPDDLAVIKIDRTGLKPATFASSDSCYVGQPVYAVGNPGGADFAWSTTWGIISYVDRELKIYNDDGTMDRKMVLLQTDARVNPGNSGGPLVNYDGEVVGIVSMKLADGYEGIGFAIPSDGALEILEAIIRYGNADSVQSAVSHKRPYIGFSGVYLAGGAFYVEDNGEYKPLDQVPGADESLAFYVPVSGVYVGALTEGMDAIGKLEVGDIVTEINGYAFTSREGMLAVVNNCYIGDTVHLKVYRGDGYIEVDVRLMDSE